MKENYRFVKSVVPDLNTWLCLNQPKAVQELSPFTDVLDVYIRQYDSSRAEAVRQSGKQVIWAVCVWPHEHPNLLSSIPERTPGQLDGSRIATAFPGSSIGASTSGEGM